MKFSEKIERAQNTSTSPEALALLAKDKDVHVRYNAANNTSTPAEALALLARDQDADTREAAKQNKSYVQPVERDIYTLFNQAMNK